MKCAEFLTELTNYLDGVLDEKTKVELENHLSWCHNCYVVCDTTKTTRNLSRLSSLYELPDDLRSRLLIGHHDQVTAAEKARSAKRITFFPLLLLPLTISGRRTCRLVPRWNPSVYKTETVLSIGESKDLVVACTGYHGTGE